MKRLEFLIISVFLALLLAETPAFAQAPDLYYLRFNEGAGTTTADMAVPGLAAAPTLVGATTWEAQPRLGVAALAMPSGAASGDQAQTNVPFALSGSWTLEFWFRNDDAASTLRYILGDSSAGSFRCYKSGASPASLVIAGTGMNSLTLSSAAPLGQWVHVAFVYDDPSLELSGYLDGVFAGTKVQTANLAFNGTSAAGLVLGGYGSSSRMIGALDEFRLYSWARSEAEIGREMGVELGNPPVDLGLSRLVAPLDSPGCDPLGAAEGMSLLVRNVGAGALPAGSQVMASYAVDGGVPVFEPFVLASALPRGGTALLAFTSGADLSAPGQHAIALTALVAGDANGANDLLTANVRSGGEVVVTSYPWIENFDSITVVNTTVPPTGWKQDQGDASGADSDWYFRSGSTTSSNTGPTGDHTTGAGFYAYVEDSGGNHPQVNLISPCFDLGSLASPRLQFALHSMNGSTGGPNVNENFLSVDIVAYPGAVTTMDALGPIGDQGPSWLLRALDLSAFAGQTIQLVFRGRSDGGSFGHDIAIDDVQVFEAQASAGQAPRAGLAVFDLNGALSPNQGPVSSGDAGPYQAQATGGGPLAMAFGGEPNQPILLLFGPSNPVAATYPGGIGQFDLGGPVDALGIPTGLQIVADGFSPVTLLYAIFVTDAGGGLMLGFTAPPLPPGPHGALQAVIGTSQPFRAAISNSVELTFL